MAQIISSSVLAFLTKSLSVAIAVAIFIGCFYTLYTLTGSQSLVHDEAVYLTKARAWSEGTPANEFRIYRPVGMAAAGWIMLQFSHEEEIIRLFGSFFGALSMVFLFLLFKNISNWWVALSVVLVAATSPVFLEQSTQFLNDIPSSGLLFGVMWLILVYFQSGGKSKTIYFAAPLAALAFYLRYGGAVSIVIIGVSATAFFLKNFFKQKDVNFSSLQLSAILFVALMAPHFIESHIYEHSLLGILSRSGTAAGREYLGEGLIDYILLLPEKLDGWIVGVSMILGVLVSFISFLLIKSKRSFKELSWVGFVGLSVFLMTGLLVHAEPRYVFFPLSLLSGVSIVGIYTIIYSRLKIVAHLGIAVLIGITLYFGLNHYQNAQQFFEGREVNLSRNAYVHASQIIQSRLNPGEKCAVWAAAFRPELSWYSECNTVRPRDTFDFEKNHYFHMRKAQYSVYFTELDQIQINPDNASSYGITLTEIYRSTKLSSSLGELVLYQIKKTHVK